MYNFSEDYTCTMKVDVNLNRDGNIQQEGETVGGKKNIDIQRSNQHGNGG